MTTTDNPVRNGVDTATLFATLDAVKADHDIAKFQFRATNRWVSGTHNRSTIHGFYGAMQEMTHQRTVRVRRRPPGRARRLRQRARPRSSSCCTPSPPASPPAWPTSPRPAGSTSPRSSSTVEGDIDLLGILGLSDEVRNGYQQIKVSFKLRGRRPRQAAPGRRAVPQALGRLRRRHQRRARRHRGRRRLTCVARPSPPAGPMTPRPARRSPPRPLEESARWLPPTRSSSAPARPVSPSAAASPTAASTTSCSNGAGSPSAGAASAGTPCACSPRTG